MEQPISVLYFSIAKLCYAGWFDNSWQIFFTFMYFQYICNITTKYESFPPDLIDSCGNVKGKIHTLMSP